ncbi:hypothetical protein PENSPDRAFT_473741 [Peniophora sp. CONT]|nr:hypothetical protein PENSPDRAFT_473741 [Peniophora sp. CONT]
MDPIGVMVVAQAHNYLPALLIAARYVVFGPEKQESNYAYLPEFWLVPCKFTLRLPTLRRLVRCKVEQLTYEFDWLQEDDVAPFLAPQCDCPSHVVRFLDDNTCQMPEWWQKYVEDVVQSLLRDGPAAGHVWASDALMRARGRMVACTECRQVLHNVLEVTDERLIATIEAALLELLTQMQTLADSERDDLCALTTADKPHHGGATAIAGLLCPYTRGISQGNAVHCKTAAHGFPRVMTGGHTLSTRLQRSSSATDFHSYHHGLPRMNLYPQ